MVSLVGGYFFVSGIGLPTISLMWLQMKTESRWVSMNSFVMGFVGSSRKGKNVDASLRMDKSAEIILKNELPCSFKKPW